MTSDGGLGKKFASSAGWVFVEQWLSKLVSVALFAVLARLLTPSDFGVVALATTFVVFLQVISNSGLASALVQKPQLDPKDASTTFWTSVSLAIGTYALLVLFARPLSAIVGEPKLANVLLVMGLIVPISTLSRTPAALLARGFAFKALSLRTIGATTISAAISLPLAFAGAGVWALVAQAVADAIFASVLLWSSTKWRPRFEYSFSSLRSMWRTGLSLLGIELLDAVQSQIDKLLVGVLFSTADLGVYSLAQRIGLMLQELTTTVVSRVSLTTFSRAQSDLVRVERIFRQLTFATATLSFPAFAIFASLSPQIVPFVFGPGWDEAIPLIWILAGGWAFASIATFDRGALVGTGHAGAAWWVAVIQNLASIGLVFAFAPLGVVGVAFSRFARLATWPVRLFALHRYIGLHVGRYVGQVAKCALAVAPALTAILFLQSTPWASTTHSFWLFAVPLGIAAFALSVGVSLLTADRSHRKALRTQFLTIWRNRSSNA